MFAKVPRFPKLRIRKIIPLGNYRNPVFGGSLQLVKGKNALSVKAPTCPSRRALGRHRQPEAATRGLASDSGLCFEVRSGVAESSRRGGVTGRPLTTSKNDEQT